MGAVTSISHRSSTEYLVEAKRAGQAVAHAGGAAGAGGGRRCGSSDSFDVLGLKATVSTVTYDYRDGYFDTREREWRGFGEVTVTEVGDELPRGEGDADARSRWGATSSPGRTRRF